ncbi:MAG: DUF4239 domain-containing protein [Chloroflexi bacterium]|nr:DUF4239 domain-containing protein [Chloroflexota bacterium]MBV9134793.1 DUF4239 domain-containing protein [Chloroflexota bacterium]MBV9896831.1 DUF4239 domain-containing protein [Chloroflexota bacterium]
MSTGILIVGGSVAVSLFGFWLVERYFPAEIRCRYNDVAGFIYAAVGVIYAILLAFVVIVVWQQFDATGSTVELEAVAAANIFHGVDEFPDPMRANVQSMVREYVERTATEEWASLANAQVDARADQLAHDIRGVIHQLPADTPRQQVMFDHVLRQYEQMITERRLRIFEAQGGVHPLLWVMLVVGALFTVAFTYVFGIDNARVHAIMITGLALVIGGMLFMIQQVDHPFAGEVHVSSEPFTTVLESFTN